jgi:hypothetical protein
MATLPDPIERRDWLHLPQKKPVDFGGIAEAYVARGRLNEAMDFAEKAEPGRRDPIRRAVREHAVKTGDAFLLGRLEHVTGAKLEDDAWRGCLSAAKQQGKQRYALKAARKLEDQKEIEELEKALGLWKPPVEVAAPAPGVDPTAIVGGTAQGVGSPVDAALAPPKPDAPQTA